MAFAAKRALLNPRFEAYRLIDDDDGDASSRVVEQSFPLPGSTFSSSSSAAAPLGYKELKDRSRHPHLAAGARPNQAAYIDGNGFVVLVTFEPEDLHPSFHPLHRISTATKELPSLIAIDSDRWLVSDGNGLVSLLRTSQLESSSRWTGAIVKTWALGQQEPFKLLSAVQLRQKDCIQFVLQRADRVEQMVTKRPGLGGSMGSSSATWPTAQTVFEILVTRIQLGDEVGVGLGAEGGDQAAGSAVTVMELVERFVSDEPCYFVEQDEATVYLAAEAPIRMDPSKEGAASPQSPPPGKRAKVTQEEDVSKLSGQNHEKLRPKRPPPPYSWTQTSETVTVVFMLPSTVEKRNVRCQFTSKALQLKLSPTSSSNDGPRIVEIGNGTEEEEEESEAAHPAAQNLKDGRYAPRSFWADTDPDGSVWTWEKVHGKSTEKEKQVSLLTLHLEKAQVGSRWTTVFKDEEEEEVPETLDPTELLDVLDGLERYAGPESTGGNVGGTTADETKPSSLLQDGLEEEDATVGKPCFVLRMQTTPPSEVQAMIPVSKEYGPGPLMCLATPLPFSPESLAAKLVFKRDLDGIVFEQEPSQGWNHVETLPALAYVLASKRDAHRTYIFPRRSTEGSVVLAFENAPAVEEERRHGTSSMGAGNLFVYYTPKNVAQPGQPLRYDNTSRSRVIRLGTRQDSKEDQEQGSPSGPLVSVAALHLETASGGEDVLVCLCQKRLLLLTNVL
ncbi:hypothetical protein FA10DRAFT_301392 [Acaromyces ingoldii]|uniref:NudC domain-containing protein 1 n=1 Tax=Acaromyces ingoldii TaxID=215250 RepID=A0A316YKM6_9BASI|nr:hypothetical protein FA10DRAFT_301392 [Acaromyces ingoldii]PWN90110.1 hypothetical protein FA10DRAFT_301392 [Acaromyces ingoldii]